MNENSCSYSLKRHSKYLELSAIYWNSSSGMRRIWPKEVYSTLMIQHASGMWYDALAKSVMSFVWDEIPVYPPSRSIRYWRSGSWKSTLCLYKIRRWAVVENTRAWKQFRKPSRTLSPLSLVIDRDWSAKVEWQAVANDKTGLFMDGGPYLLWVYLD